MDVFSKSVDNVSPTEDNPPSPIYGMCRGLLKLEQIREIVSRYRVPLEFVCRLLGGSKCISCPGSVDVAVCEETFRVGFCLPLHLFIEWLLAKYGLMPAQIHPNLWRMTFSFVIKCGKVRLESKMRAFRSILALKASLSGNSVVYASYRKSALAHLIYETFYR